MINVLNSWTELHYSVHESRMILHLYIVAEREEGELHKFEVMHSEGDAYDRDAENDTPQQVG